MKTSMKMLAAASVLALGLATAGTAEAQTENVVATLTTSSAITTTLANDMNFGEWLIQFGTDTPALTLTDDGTNGVTQSGTVTDSQVVNVSTAAQQEGGLTVDVPAPAVMQMVASNFTDIVDAGLSLTDVTYRTVTENGSIITGATVTAAVPVTVVTGNGTPEPVALGGTIAITGTPGDLAHTADFDVTFSY
ncbi:MAG: hypothetical protein AAF204_02985 [Pseudomonadota bacterium]